MRFAQTISVHTDKPEELAELLAQWDQGQANAPIMGYIGTRLLADRDAPGHYLILAEFAEVDETRSSAEEAESNNRREETERWVQSLRELVQGEPEWVHYDEWYRTGITGSIRTG